MKNRKSSFNNVSPIFIITIAIFLFVFLSHHLYNDVHQSTSLSSRLLSSYPPPPSPPPPQPPLLLFNSSSSSSASLSAIEEPSSSSSSSSSSSPPESSSSSSSTSLSTIEESSSPPPPSPSPPPPTPSPPPPTPSPLISTVSILIPDWQVLVLTSPETPLERETYTCVYPNGESSPARFAGELPFRGGAAFTCEFPARNRRRLPFLQPRLLPQHEINRPLEERENQNQPNPELLRWNFLAYESFTTENDVVLLVKGVNNHQGINRSPSDLRCVFGDNPLTAVKTAVTSSEQEVFRCVRPHIPELHPHSIAVTLEIVDPNPTATIVVPSVAKYAPDQPRTISFSEPKSLICACTMVYNVAKFLREWVTYHAAIGVGRFILYDNDSDDDLRTAVRELNRAGFDVRTVYWPWPKTQEAGFSHGALYSDQICEWVAFLDVDEFILSPTWLDTPGPTPDLLRSTFLHNHGGSDRVGQVSIRCNEFGPSGQTAHPVDGVTQGYTCRRRVDQRHKSIVLLEAMHPSLLNVIHHFKLRDGYRSSQPGPNRAIVNHYKYQAWPEFRAKFRRRVSAYVVDWRLSLNMASNDRAPGLGYEPIEPPGWPERFCEVRDERLKDLTRRWFGLTNSSTMAWQSA